MGGKNMYDNKMKFESIFLESLEKMKIKEW